MFLIQRSTPQGAMSTLLSEDNGRFSPSLRTWGMSRVSLLIHLTVWDRKPQWCIISELADKPCMGIHSSACDTVAQAANIYISEVGVMWARAADDMLGAGVSQSAIRVKRQAGRPGVPRGRSKGSSSPTTAQWGLSHSRNCQQILHCQKHILLNIVLEEQPS